MPLRDLMIESGADLAEKIGTLDPATTRHADRRESWARQVSEPPAVLDDLDVAVRRAMVAAPAAGPDEGIVARLHARLEREDVLTEVDPSRAPGDSADNGWLDRLLGHEGRSYDRPPR